MSNIQIIGKQKINDIEFNGISGGFGEGKKAMLVKDIASIHGRELRVINQNIERNRKRFLDNVDIVDLKSITQSDRDLLNDLGFSNSSISNAKNIYSLSERGYAKLLKILEDDVAWDVYDKLVDRYFNMKDIIQSDEQLKAQLLLSIYNGGQDGIIASSKLTEMEVNHRTKELQNVIDIQAPKAESYDEFLTIQGEVSIGDFAKSIGLGSKRVFKILRDRGILMSGNNHNIPSQSYIDAGLFKVNFYSHNSVLCKKVMLTAHGMVWLEKNLRKNGFIG